MPVPHIEADPRALAPVHAQPITTALTRLLDDDVPLPGYLSVSSLTAEQAVGFIQQLARKNRSRKHITLHLDPTSDELPDVLHALLDPICMAYQEWRSTTRMRENNTLDTLSMYLVVPFTTDGQPQRPVFLTGFDLWGLSEENTPAFTDVVPEELLPTEQTTVMAEYMRDQHAIVPARAAMD